MLFKIITGPVSSHNLDVLLEHVSVARGPVCAVVPDGHTSSVVQRRIAAVTEGAFLGSRVSTFEGLAAAVAGLHAPVPGIIHEHMRRSLISEIVRSRIGSQSRFARVAEYQGFIALVNRFIKDVRSGRADPDAMDPEIAGILNAYESHLHRLGLTDHEGMVSLALRGDAPEQYAARFRGPLIIHGFYDFTEKQFALVARLVSAFFRSAATVVFDPMRPGLFALPGSLIGRYEAAGGMRIDADRPQGRSSAGEVMAGFHGGQYPGTGEAGSMQMHSFRGIRAEADWVAGTAAALINEGARPDDILIASRHPVAYGDRMERALRRHNVPVAGGVARPLMSHPVVTFVLDALHASVHHNESDREARVRTSAYSGMKNAHEHDQDQLDDRAWCCMFAENDTPEGYIQSLKRMLDWLGVCQRLDGGGDAARAASECVAWGRLIDLADEFAGFYTPLRPMMRAEEFVRLFERYIEPAMLQDEPANAAGVILVDVNHARYATCGIVFVTGMGDGQFPARFSGYSLHDSSSDARLRDRYAAEEPLLFYMTAHEADRLFFTFPGIDDEGGDSSMSPYLREIAAGAQWSVPHTHVAIPGAVWEGGSPNPCGTMEQLMRLMKRDYSGAPSILASVRESDSRLADILARAVDVFVTYAHDRPVALTGHPAYDPLAMNTDRIMPVTELERYLGCPVRYFLERIMGLGIEIPVSGELTYADRGKIIHDILAQFYRQRRERAGRTSFRRSERPGVDELMSEVVEDVFRRVTGRNISVHPTVLVTEKAFVNRWMQKFLDAETEYFEQNDFEPWAFEVPFGTPDASETGQAAPPLEIGDGQDTILVGGRIDRIDRGTRGKQTVIRVVDYKTGSSVKPSIRDIEEGSILQVPLYLAAAESMCDDAVKYDGVYYSLQEMTMKEFKESRAPLVGLDWDAYILLAKDRAAMAVRNIRDGLFPMTSGECGKYCEFLPLCRGGKHDMEGDE